MIKNSVRAYILVSILFAQSCSKMEELTDVPPEAAILVYPEDNKTCEQGIDKVGKMREVDFQWKASANTKSYELLIIDLESHTTAYSELNILGTSRKVILEKGKPYSWQVISKSYSSTKSAKSNIAKMYLIGEGVTNYAPFPADVLFPPFGESVLADNGKVSLLWTGSDPDGENLIYTVYLDTIDGKQLPLKMYSNLSNQQLEVAVEANSTYYWRIKSSDPTNSSFTRVHRFSTD